MIPWFHSHHFIWKRKQNKITWYKCHKSVDTMLQCKTYLHQQSGRRGKKLLCRPKSLRNKMTLTHTCAKNRHSLRKKNISRVGVDQMHCPNSMLVGGLGLKSYQRENSECFDLFFGLRENRVVATVLKTVFSTTNCSFKHIFTKCD